MRTICIKIINNIFAETPNEFRRRQTLLVCHGARSNRWRKETMASRLLPVATCFLLVMAFHAKAEENQTEQKTEDTAFADVQKHFAEAYNRGDVDAMAGAFSENSVRVTPSGIFQGRDAIRRNLQDAINMGLHDYTVRRTLSRSQDGFVFNAGEWQAKLGDKSFHGYYTSILVREGDQAKIMEETVTIAAP